MNKNQPLERLCGAGFDPARPLMPFSDRAVSFLNDLSALLLKNTEAKGYPDVITFAFFCRRANVERLKAEYAGALEDRLGRGMVFHIAPSNVPINFAYSLVTALLAGNQSVVKASSRDFAQTRIVCSAINALLCDAYSTLAPYINVVIYPREAQNETERLSAMCAVRVIWGGDETVKRVREAALPPRAFDITFADRYSLLCVSAQEINAMTEIQLAKVAKDFYNDTYLSDQNACTAPRLVYWLCEGGAGGESLEPARNRFWDAMHAYASAHYTLEPVVAVDKLTAACRAGIELTGARLMPMSDNLMVRVMLGQLTPDLDAHRCAGGFFLEYADETLEALVPAVKSNYQTLSYLGLDPLMLQRFVRERGLFAIDRIVPIGHTMDFSLTWDGYDLIRTLSRRITILS